MGVATSQVTVGTTPTIFRPDSVRTIPPGASLLIANRGSVAVFVGTSDVTPTTGFQLDPDQRMSFPVGTAGERIYAVTASGTTVCHLIQTDSYA